MKEKKMGFFKKLFNSLYNFKSYNTFLSQSMGKAISYIFLLTLILELIFSSALFVVFNSFLPDLKTELREKVPEFEYKQNKLTIEGDMPIIFENNEMDFFVYIDTENTIDDSILDEHLNGYLITSESITVKQGIQKESVALSSLELDSLDKDTLINFIPNKVPVIFMFFIYFFMVLFSFLLKIIGTFILGVVGTILSKIMKVSLTYFQCFKLGLYSLTAPVIILTLNMVSSLTLEISLTLPFYIILFLASIFLGFGIKAIKKERLSKLEDTVFELD